MGMYLQLVQSHKSADQSKMWASVRMVDELLEAMKDHHKEQYDEFIRKTIMLYYDSHFDQALADMVVKKMYHNEKINGVPTPIYGEHYNIEFARKVKMEYRDINHNEWDWYVLLNMVYHDNIMLLKEWFPSEQNYNNKVVDIAVNYITDDDASETKLWDYFMS